ncbi:MAG TPA: DnaJ domain-containing protein [Candidatus Limnocylindrales bacterium]|nr:DnaJ domain-containing protein [Candidatus Limnocylindrales bacterium]
MAIDPYRTLGLLPGATPAEVKRAYRRLAKAFHPDSAGPEALPRFLAIQEAYEHLATGRSTGRRAGSAAAGFGGGGGAASAAAGAGPEPWRADPSRAREAREQARARARGAGGAGAAAGSRGGSATGTRTSGGATGGGSRTAGPGAAGGSGAAGSGAAGAPRRRASRKATMGSTSYDEARESTDPTWGGASWYGPTSGEYWRVNPREYADPRKHGPEYQSRARRQSTTTGEAWDASGPAKRATAPGGPAERAWTPPPRMDARAHAASGDRGLEDDPGPGEALASLGRLLDTEPRDPVRRAGFALLAWAPIGLASAAVIGAATGCASFSAACTGAAPLLPWLAQAVIVGLLFLIPMLARILAAGTAAVVIAMVPLTGLLIAFGGSGEPAAPVILQALLAIAWIAGVAIAIAGLIRTRQARAA